MPNITLPDGKKLNFKSNISGVDIAEKASTLINRKDLNEVIKKAKKISEKADWKIVAEFPIYTN